MEKPRHEQQLEKILGRNHVQKVVVSFERSQLWNGKIEMECRVIVWCTHHHAPFSSRASSIETALGRVETWLDTQESESFRGVSCNEQGFKKQYEHLKSRCEDYVSG